MLDGALTQKTEISQQTATASEISKSTGLLVGLKKRSLWRVVGLCVSLMLIGFAIFSLSHILLTANYAQLSTALHTIDGDQILLALLFTFLSYLALTGYDAVALIQLKLKIAYRITALASFAAYAISFVLGFPLLTGGTIRYWIYSRRGLSAAQVASLTLVAGITFWLGMVLIISIALLIEPDALAAIDHLSNAANWWLGLLVLVGLLGYLIFVSIAPRTLKVKQFSFQLPGFTLTLVQISLGLVDLVCAATTLYFLLPAGHQADFVTFLAIYILAVILGIISHAPGGIGIFEVTILNVVSEVPKEAVLASLLLFRVIYFIVPFILALACLGAYEGRRRWKRLSEAISRGAEGES